MQIVLNYDSKMKTSSNAIEQLWQKSGSCPEGTIPITRTRKSDLLRKLSFEKNSAPGMEVSEIATLF